MPSDTAPPQGSTLNDAGLDLVFREARSLRYWQDKPVARELLQAVYDLAKMGPTTGNSCPARFVFVMTDEGKARLKPHLDEFNVRKVMTAPATVIIAYDMKFYDKVPELFPHNPAAREWYVGSEEKVRTIALRNGSLQGAYLMLAARSLGLDCGPMSGFSNEGVDKEFFKGTDWKSNFICALGYGDRERLHPRLPRLAFDTACRIE